MFWYVKWTQVVSAGIYNNKFISNFRYVSFQLFTLNYSDIVQVMCNSTLLKKFKKRLKCYQVDSLRDCIINGNSRNIKLTVMNYWYPDRTWQYNISFNNLKCPVSMLNQNHLNHTSRFPYNHLRYYSDSNTQGQRYGKCKFQNHSRNNGKNNYYKGKLF